MLIVEHTSQSMFDEKERHMTVNCHKCLINEKDTEILCINLGLIKI